MASPVTPLFSAAPAYKNDQLASRTPDSTWTAPAGFVLFDSVKINILGASAATASPATELKSWFDSNKTIFDQTKNYAQYLNSDPKIVGDFPPQTVSDWAIVVDLTWKKDFSPRLTNYTNEDKVPANTADG